MVISLLLRGSHEDHHQSCPFPMHQVAVFDVFSLHIHLILVSQTELFVGLNKLYKYTHEIQITWMYIVANPKAVLLDVPSLPCNYIMQGSCCNGEGAKTLPSPPW